MKLGIFAKTIALDNVDQAFEAVRKHGIGCVQYNMACSGLPALPSKIGTREIQDINKASERHQISICGLSATFNMIDPNLSTRQKGLTSMELLAKTSNQIGTDFLTLCTGSRHPSDKWKWHEYNLTQDAWNDLTSMMEKTIEIAEKYNILLGIEPEMGNVVQNARMARKLLNELRSERLKIILDPANLFELLDRPQQINDFIDEALDLLHHEIAIVHAKDRRLNGQITAPGKGDINFEYLVDQLRQMNFDGPIIMHGLKDSEVAESTKYLKTII